jgi:hypothetical protein
MEIPPTWQFVRNVKRMIEEELLAYPEQLRYATSMVASELAGNAIKYGDKTEGAPRPTLSISARDNQILIEVTNRVLSSEALQQATMRIDQMAQSDKKEEFYLNRLQELLTGSSHGSRLGLYRIGYEGAFDLSYSCVDNMLTIKATRGIS